MSEGGPGTATKNGNGHRKKFEDKAASAKKKFGESGEVMVELAQHVLDEVHASTDSIRADVRGAKEAAANAEIAANRVADEAKEIRAASESAKEMAVEAEGNASAAATEAGKASLAAAEARNAVAEIRENLGPTLDAKLEERMGLEAVIDGEKRKLSPRDVVLQVWKRSGNALSTAGSALRMAEQAAADAKSAAEQVAAANELVQQENAGNQEFKREMNGLMEKTQEAAAKAEELVGQANKKLDGLRHDFDEFVKKTDAVIGVFMQILEKNGLNLDVDVDDSGG